MKTTFTTALVATFMLALQAHAYLNVADDAVNIRRFHMIKRADNGDIVGRALMSTYDLVERDHDTGLEKRRKGCTTINACGTAGGCAIMAGQTYCKGKDWNESFQEAVKQTGANGRTGLKIMADGIARGPAGTLLGAATATASALQDAKKNDKKKTKEEKAEEKKKKKEDKQQKKEAKQQQKEEKQKKKKEEKQKKKATKQKKRALSVDDDIILNRQSYEVVERDVDLNFVARGVFSTYHLVSRDESGSIVTRECESYNGNEYCL